MVKEYSFVDSGKLTSFSTSKLRGQKFKQPKPTSSLSLQRFTAYNGSLSKLQGQGYTLWRICMEEDPNGGWNNHPYESSSIQILQIV